MRVVWLTSLVFLSLPLAAKEVTLGQLLERLDEGPALQQAAQQLQAAQAEQALREAEQGWSLFGSASTGDYRDLDTNGAAETYDDYVGQNYQLGLRYPLLGSLKRQVEAVNRSRSAVQQQQLQLALQKAEQRLLLRGAYADWWAAQAVQQWCGQLQAKAGEAQASLDARWRAGWLRTSAAQEQQHAWRALQRQCRDSAGQQAVAQSMLALLVPLPAAGTARPEALPSQPQSLQAWQGALTRHPRLSQREQALQLADEQRGSRWYDSVDSSFSLAQSLQDRNDYQRNGDGLVASLAFAMPFDLLGADQARQRLGEANYQAAQQALAAERQQLQFSVHKGLRAYRQSLDALQGSLERVQQAEQLWRERQARRVVEGEEGLLAVLEAEQGYQAALLGRIQAWHGAWLREAELRLLLDDQAELEPLLGDARLHWPSAADVGVSVWSQGVYIWDSRALLDPQQRAAELQRLQRSGLQQLYVGLSAAQVGAEDGSVPALAALLQAAEPLGLQVSLLLGEPSWITPQGRPELLRLLERYRQLPFAGLHLDLEVEQLGWPVPAERLRQWLDTLAAVTRQSPWPLAISSHPRWFEAPTADAPCVPCALEQVEQISLMIYQRDPRRSAAAATAIAARWPQLRFRLAQSVERKLQDNLSWKGASATQLQTQVAAWQPELSAAGISGVDWQDWQDYPR